MRYLYRCDWCFHNQELRFSMDDKPDMVPCRCGRKARRVFTVPNVIYSGVGWSGPGHGVPDRDERAKQPKGTDFSDLLED